MKWTHRLARARGEADEVMIAEPINAVLKSRSIVRSGGGRDARHRVSVESLQNNVFNPNLQRHPDFPRKRLLVFLEWDLLASKTAR